MLLLLLQVLLLNCGCQIDNRLYVDGGRIIPLRGRPIAAAARVVVRVVIVISLRRSRGQRCQGFQALVVVHVSLCQCVDFVDCE
jgi:hypothetical protein